jgi:hypothetical protein
LGEWQGGASGPGATLRAPTGIRERPAGPVREPPLASKCVKRSQFRRNEAEGQVLWGKRVVMHWARKGPRSNKANCRVDSKWARGGKPVLAAGATHCAKRSQSAAYQPEEVPAGRAISVAATGANAPNKANGSWVTRKASTLWRTSYGELDSQRALAKQSQFAPGRWRVGVGKAVRAAGGTHCAKRSQSVGPLVYRQSQ